MIRYGGQAMTRHKARSLLPPIRERMETLFREFERYFFIKGKSPETIRKYLKDLRQFVRENAITSVNAINRERVHAWVFTLRGRDCSEGTIANHLWAIKAFLRWLASEKNVACYEFDVQIPRVPAPETVEYLEPEELDRLFSVIDVTHLCGLRLRTFIEVMINTGLRPSEALKLQRDDLDGDELEIVGKGNKRRKIYVNERVRYWVSKYRRARTDDHPGLFVTHGSGMNAEALSLRHTEYIFQDAFLRAGIRKRVVLHTLRHTYATTLLANGCPLDYVAVLLGHSKVETTRRHYVSIQHKHARKAHFRFLSYERAPTEGDKDVPSWRPA